MGDGLKRMGGGKKGRLKLKRAPPLRGGRRLPQKTKRKPSCPCRGLLYWLLMTPKLSPPNVVLGVPNLGVLNALKNSARISKYLLSVNSTFLESPRSML